MISLKLKKAFEQAQDHHEKKQVVSLKAIKNMILIGNAINRLENGSPMWCIGNKEQKALHEFIRRYLILEKDDTESVELFEKLTKYL